MHLSDLLLSSVKPSRVSPTICALLTPERGLNPPQGRALGMGDTQLGNFQPAKNNPVKASATFSPTAPVSKPKPLG